MALTGCGYGADEPGLFAPQPAASETPSRSLPRRAPSGVLLPVAGEAVWTLQIGSPTQVRIAVHGVRRVAGGTVLDWSLTPLPNETTPIGRRLPDGVVAGLGATEVALVDRFQRMRYTPLTDPATGRCVCTQLDPAVARLRAGGTSLLQTAFPGLPATVEVVDVAVPLVPTFPQVPVAPIDLVHRAEAPTDLSRPAAPVESQATSPTFRYPPARQEFRIELGPVVAGDSFTSIIWRVEAVTAGPGLPDSRQLPAPQVRRGGRIDGGQPRLAGGRAVPDPSTVRQPVALDGSGPGERSAGRGSWTGGLRRPGDKIELVTTVTPQADWNGYGLDIVFPGLTTVTEAAVTAATPAPTRTSAPQTYRQRFWAAATPPAPLAVSYWPTPIPDQTILAAAIVSPPVRV